MLTIRVHFKNWQIFPQILTKLPTIRWNSINIARGTTDPRYRVCHLNSFSIWNQFDMVLREEEPFRHWYIYWSSDGTHCISCIVGHQMASLENSSKFGHQMAPLALLTNLVTRWYHLHQFKIWPPDGTTWVTCIATLPWIALLALSVSIELVSSSARVTSVESVKPLRLTHSLS